MDILWMALSKVGLTFKAILFIIILKNTLSV